MGNFDGCQLPCLPKISEGEIDSESQPWFQKVKRRLAKPWNYSIKRYLKRMMKSSTHLIPALRPLFYAPAVVEKSSSSLVVGDWVRVRSAEEIESTLDFWKELRGCAFLDGMKEYCNTKQRVFVVMERFLDERDYKVKKSKGIVLLEGVYCLGTPVFGRCDRRCLFFWREEWLEKIDQDVLV